MTAPIEATEGGGGGLRRDHDRQLLSQGTAVILATARLHAPQMHAVKTFNRGKEGITT